MIDQVTIDRILDAAQIMDVVSDFVTLRKRGVNYVGLCPFHSDKTPSFLSLPPRDYALRFHLFHKQNICIIPWRERHKKKGFYHYGTDTNRRN